MAKNIVVVTRSLNEGRIRQNIEGSVKASKLLTKEDIALLDGLAAAGKQKRMVMPPWGASFDLLRSMIAFDRPQMWTLISCNTVV